MNLLTAAALFMTITFTSCSKKSDSVPADLCKECHIALDDKSETIWDITTSSGEEDFCGQELSDVESLEAVYILTDTLYADGTNEILLPGEYGPGSTNSQYEIHCGEEDHDDH